MKCLFKSAISIVMLTMAAVAESSAKMSDVPDLELCAAALAPGQSAWSQSSDHSASAYVTEAERRGFNVKKCRRVLAQKCSQPDTTKTIHYPGILARPEIQELAATALAQTKQEWSGSKERFEAGDVFTNFQQKLLRIVETNIPVPYYPKGVGPAYHDYGFAYESQRAVSDMTYDQFITCFPQGWQLALVASRVQRELKERQEEGGRQARIEAAKPINRLRQSYFDYMVVKRCYDLRLGYQLVYVNEVERERARAAISAIEISILGEDSSIDKDGAWQAAARAIEASNQYLERNFCQQTYNELLSAAPYSPPVKDFGR